MFSWDEFLYDFFIEPLVCVSVDSSWGIAHCVVVHVVTGIITVLIIGGLFYLTGSHEMGEWYEPVLLAFLVSFFTVYRFVIAAVSFCLRCAKKG